MIYKSSDDGVRDEAGMSFCVYDCVCYVCLWCLCIVWYGENVSMNMMSMSKYEDGDGKLFRLVGFFFFFFFFAVLVFLGEFFRRVRGTGYV